MLCHLLIEKKTNVANILVVTLFIPTNCKFQITSGRPKGGEHGEGPGEGPSSGSLKNHATAAVGALTVLLCFFPYNCFSFSKRYCSSANTIAKLKPKISSDSCFVT